MFEAIDDALAAFDISIQSLVESRREKFAALIREAQAFDVLDTTLSGLEARASELLRRNSSNWPNVLREQIRWLEGDMWTLRRELNGLLGTVGREFNEVARLGKQLDDIKQRRSKAARERANRSNWRMGDINWQLQCLEGDLNYVTQGNEEWIRDPDPLSRAMRDMDEKIREGRANVDTLSVLVSN